MIYTYGKFGKRLTIKKTASPSVAAKAALACILSRGVLCFLHFPIFGRFPMAKRGKKHVYVRVKDEAGNAFLCPIDALKDIKKATEEELENCVDNAVAERYGGEIEVADKSSTRKSAATQARDT
jgi:hypothetical protein